MHNTLIMRNLWNYASIEASVKYTTKYLLSSVKALDLEKRTFSEKSEFQIENFWRIP